MSINSNMGLSRRLFDSSNSNSSPAKDSLKKLDFFSKVEDSEESFEKQPFESPIKLRNKKVHLFSSPVSSKRKIDFDDTFLSKKRPRTDQKNFFHPLNDLPPVKKAIPQKIDILPVDYADLSKGKILRIPGFENPFVVDELGQGSNHKVYSFREPGTIQISQNSFFNSFQEGEYPLNSVVFKTFIQSISLKSQRAIKALEKPLLNNEDPRFTTIYFYCADGSSLEQKIESFDSFYKKNPKEAISKGMAFIKEIFAINAKEKKTVYFDVKPWNIGFSDEGKVLILDRNQSPNPESYINDMADDLLAWMNYENKEQHIYSHRFSVLTEGLTDSVTVSCKAKIQKLSKQ